MGLQIPEEQIPAILKIRNLSSVQAEELITALKSAPIEFGYEDMAKRIAANVRSIHKKDLIAILRAIYELYFVREFANVSSSTFLDDLLESIQDSANPELNLAPEEIATIRTRFEELLSIEAINTISKSARLQRDGERLYCGCKILSDMRPVFTEDPTASPVGAVVTHTLKLTYHRGENTRDFFVVLDAEDLNHLNDVVERAIAKDKTLRRLRKGGLPILGI